MSKITYLFGAGASCNALPMVKQIPIRLQAIIDLLKEQGYLLDSTYYDNLPKEIDKTKSQLQIEMIEALEWLKGKSGSHASVDTFAKKLYLNRNEAELKKLKLALTVFFIVEQTLTKPDDRYDSFYAAILDGSKRLPKNLKFITWNYDYQFELALRDYTQDKRLTANQELLMVLEKNTFSHPDDQFNIFRLNGSTTFQPKNGRIGLKNRLVGDHAEINIEFIGELVRNFALVLNNQNTLCNLSFAWEWDFQKPDIIEQSISGTSDTEILVVIGYSFPFFNREVDRKIIQAMKGLKKVYFQAPDAENLVERFQAIRDNIDPKFLIPKFDTAQFFLPNEL